MIDNDGHILTNNHVVANSSNITVRVGGEDGQTFDADVVGLQEVLRAGRLTVE